MFVYMFCDVFNVCSMFPFDLDTFLMLNFDANFLVFNFVKPKKSFVKVWREH